MIQIKKLLRTDIRYACGDTYFNRGRDYFEQGKVLTLEVVDESENIVTFHSRVDGSGTAPYQLKITLRWSPNYTSADITGYCTCPVGRDCKHIAASCLAYQHWDKMPAAAETTKAACLKWLEQLESSSSLTQQDAAFNRKFIAYVLKPAKLDHELSVDLLITRIKRNGVLSKGQKFAFSNLLYGYAVANAYPPQDKEIAKILYLLAGTYQNPPIISGSTGYLAISRLLETGRLFWNNLENRPLTNGEERSCQFVWQENEEGYYRLNIKIASEAKLLLTDPPLYLDTSQGTIGPLTDCQFTHEQLKKILTIPLIPAEYVTQFSEKLIMEHPDFQLPPPQPISITELNGLSPRPQLSLFGLQDQGRYQHFMALTFGYDDWSIPPTADKEYMILKNDEGIFRLQRNLQQESSAVELITALGFSPSMHPETKQLIFFSPGDRSIMDSALRWNQFIQKSITELEEKNWLITIEPSFQLNFQEAGNWDAEIEETGNNWFEMRFNIVIEGKSIPLLPLIMQVLEEFDPEQLPETVTIPLTEYNYLSLPGAKLKPFLDILYELFDSSTQTDNGALRMSRFDAVNVAELEAHNDGLFSLHGGAALRELGQKLKNFAGIQDASPPDNLNTELRHYQQQGLNWLQFLREYKLNGILADDMGLGKTVQTLAHLLLEKEAGRMTSPCLIIAPTSLMSNWRREAERFTPDLRVLILQGPERNQYFDKLEAYDLILTTYPLLPRDEEQLLKYNYHFLVLDEAQIVKNPRAKAARIIRKIDASHRLCLTGTPMENHLGELWSQFDFLMPGFLGNQQQFKKIYRTPIEKHADMQQRGRLAKRIAPFMLRRTKQEVEKELPPKTEIIRSVPLYAKQAALYESIRLSMEKKVRNTIAKKGLSRSHITILDALLKLRQTCCDPRTLTLKQAQNIKESAKLDLLMEMLPEQLEEGRRILLFSQFTRMLALIETELLKRNITYSKLTGQTRNRDEAIERFRSGAADVFLISLKAGGVGLNLTEADTVIHYDPWWNPAAEAQATDRAHRIGQDKPVFIYKLITEETVEEKILALQEKKRALANGVYRKTEQDQAFNLSADDLNSLFEPLA
jgi:superfamily II DNA or RNA helicase